MPLINDATPVRVHDRSGILWSGTVKDLETMNCFSDDEAAGLRSDLFLSGFHLSPGRSRVLVEVIPGHQPTQQRGHHVADSDKPV